MVKFDRSEVIEIINSGGATISIVETLFDEIVFDGSDGIKTIANL